MRERSSHNRRRTRRRPPEFCTPSGFAPSAWRGAALDRTQEPPRYFTRRADRPQTS
jgi:hypothetical protein